MAIPTAISLGCYRPGNGNGRDFLHSAGQSTGRASAISGRCGRQNQELAERQAGAERREGYEAMITKRQETARLIGRQRAAAGASGAAVDVGSNLDLQADTAAQGRDRRAQRLQRGIGQRVQL